MEEEAAEAMLMGDWWWYPWRPADLRGSIGDRSSMKLKSGESCVRKATRLIG
jgi:hypothetical protein